MLNESFYPFDWLDLFPLNLHISGQRFESLPIRLYHRDGHMTRFTRVYVLDNSRLAGMRAPDNFTLSAVFNFPSWFRFHLLPLNCSSSPESPRSTAHRALLLSRSRHKSFRRTKLGPNTFRRLAPSSSPPQSSEYPPPISPPPVSAPQSPCPRTSSPCSPPMNPPSPSP